MTPEKFTYVDSAFALRVMLSHYDVRTLELLPEDTFGDLTTYPLITVLEKSRSDGATRIFDRAGTEKAVRIPRGGDSWGPLLNGSIQDFKPEPMTDVLSTICERVSCGVATGADGIFVFEKSELPADFNQFAWPTVSGRDLDISSVSPNPPKDTDGRREDSGRGVRELQGRWPGLHWGRWEVGGRSSVAAQGPYGRLRELRCAGWRENTQQGTLADRGGASLRGRWVSRRLAVRPGVEWLAAGPRRE